MDQTPRLTPNAMTVLKERYLWRDERGYVQETPEQLFRRVARSVAAAEGRGSAKLADQFYDMMVNLRFLPNTPTLINAGKKMGQLSACFVLPVEDSLDGIFDSLKQAAKIHQSGGGTGFSFSHLRAKGSVVKSTHGTASGPISFMRIYDTATETIKQGGVRRGANMAVLRVDHPDILEFIESKRDYHSILNFNISVGITDDFMVAVRVGREFALRHPGTGVVAREIRARELFKAIVRSAWECGDPGLVFLDRINLFNPTPMAGMMESTNPCGEQPLLPYESCNLGSLNLGKFVGEKNFNWDTFREAIWLAVRFLDDVIEVNQFPVAESEQLTQRNRKIGLGVMGFADILLELGIPYDSEDARQLGERIMSFLDREAKFASADLAKERGAFPNWKGSLWQKLGYPPMRNATVSTIAPTGTISIIAGASSGIEPIFAGVFYRNVLSGKQLVEIHPAVERIFKAKGISIEQVSDEKISRVLGKAWKPAQKVSVEDHVKMQAVFQRHCDSAVSKTINLPVEASLADVEKAYTLAYELGCKGITIYRDQSRPSQVLEKTKEGPMEENAQYCEVCND